MSRSYRKTPYAGLKKCKFSKNYANRKVRKAEEQRTKIASGSSYKKLSDSWDICDYHDIETWKEFKQRIHRYFLNYHTGHTVYTWLYYCRRYKMELDVINWKKVKWIWYKMYKNK